MTDLFLEAENMRQEVARKNIKVNHPDKVKLPYFKSRLRQTKERNSPLTNTAIITLCTALTYEVVQEENARREGLNKKIKKADEKHLPVPFDVATIYKVATLREGFTEDMLRTKSVKGSTRIFHHIRDCIRDHDIPLKIEKEFPHAIEGMTSKIACDIFSVT